MQQIELLASVEAFLSEMNMSASTFGTKAVKDPNFVFRLRDGLDPRLGTVNRVLAFMDHERQAATASR